MGFQYQNTQRKKSEEAKANAARQSKVPSTTPQGIPRFLQAGLASAQTPEETPVKITFFRTKPWLFSVEGSPTPAEISFELYGSDLTNLLTQEESFDVGNFAFKQFYVAIPQLMRPKYQQMFHQLMRTTLEKDIRFVKDKLFETRIDADDESVLIFTVRQWAETKDIRTPEGESYFDAFIGRLQRDKYYTDYLITESDSRPYLSLLYNEVEERAGELNSLIAQNSVKYGGYRPIWDVTDEKGEIRPNARIRGVNVALVSRTTNMVLNALEGRTSDDDSKIISDSLVGLPPMEQAQVLRQIMSRYDETDWTGIIGRFGEAWEGGMLYYLFEDMTEGDAKRVGQAFVDNGVMSQEAVDGLIAGRGFVASLLPYTTRKGQEATEFWADIAVHSEGAGSVGASVMGGFSSLWMPETAGATILTLGTAGLGDALAPLALKFPRIALWVGRGGTVVGGASALKNIADLVTGTDIFTGEELDEGEIIARWLTLGADAIFASIGIASMLKARSVKAPKGLTQAGAGTSSVKTPSSTPHTSGKSDWEPIPIGHDPETGLTTFLVKHHPTQEYAIMKVNMAEGYGSMTHVASGKTIQFSKGGGVSTARGALPHGPSSHPQPTATSAARAGSTTLAEGAAARRLPAPTRHQVRSQGDVEALRSSSPTRPPDLDEAGARLWDDYQVYYARRLNDIEGQLARGTMRSQPPRTWESYHEIRTGNRADVTRGRAHQDRVTATMDDAAEDFMTASDVGVGRKQKPGRDKGEIVHPDQLIVDRATRDVTTVSNKSRDFRTMSDQEPTMTAGNAAIEQQVVADVEELFNKYSGDLYVRRRGHPLYGEQVNVREVILVYEGAANLTNRQLQEYISSVARRTAHALDASIDFHVTFQ